MKIRNGRRLDLALEQTQSEGVMLPYELWLNLVEIEPCAVKGMETSIRLFSGEVVQGLLISAFGEIVRRGESFVDSPPSSLKTEDIEAVQVPALHFWQRPRWLALNPRHPGRRSHHPTACGKKVAVLQ